MPLFTEACPSASFRDCPLLLPHAPHHSVLGLYWGLRAQTRDLSGWRPAEPGCGPWAWLWAQVLQGHRHGVFPGSSHGILLSRSDEVIFSPGALVSSLQGRDNTISLGCFES